MVGSSILTLNISVQCKYVPLNMFLKKKSRDISTIDVHLMQYFKAIVLILTLEKQLTKEATIFFAKAHEMS